MVTEKINGVLLSFETNEKVFSPSSVDEGTLSMLSQVEFKETDKVLDLGCGYGVVGILAGKLIGEQNVTMCDISEDAVGLSKVNAERNLLPHIRIIKSDGLDNVEDRNFTLILSNPPYHADFSVPKKFIEMGFHKLAVGGKMVMVTKRRDWYKNKLISVFGGVRIVEINGYYVFTAEKRSVRKKEKKKNDNVLSRKLKRKRKEINPAKP